MRRDEAEIVALGALTWLVENEHLDTFQAATGADLANIRNAAGEPEFLAAVIEFVMNDDEWVRGVCTAQGLPFDSLLRARAALPGGDLPHWT